MENNFVTDVLSNPNNTRILECWDTLCLPDGWLVAGCLFQTMWNRISNQAPETGIKDYDIFYYDAADLSSEAEQTIQLKAEVVDQFLKVAGC